MDAVERPDRLLWGDAMTPDESTPAAPVTIPAGAQYLQHRETGQIMSLARQARKQFQRETGLTGRAFRKARKRGQRAEAEAQRATQSTQQGMA